MSAATVRSTGFALAVFVSFALVLMARADEAVEFTIESPAFGHGKPIPRVYTCEGRDISPALTFQGVPAKARSLVLIVDDPDAPDPEAPKMTWVHWVLYNIPVDTEELPRAVAPAKLPDGTGQGINSRGRPGYHGPCPPIGRHRYFYKLYALDTVLKGLDKPTKDELLKAMEGHVVAKAELVGTYRKQGKK